MCAYWNNTHNLYNVYLRGIYELPLLEQYSSLKVQVIKQLGLVFVLALEQYFHKRRKSFATQTKRQFPLRITNKAETRVVHISIAHSLWQKTKTRVMKMTNSIVKPYLYCTCLARKEKQLDSISQLYPWHTSVYNQCYCSLTLGLSEVLLLLATL